MLKKVLDDEIYSFPKETLFKYEPKLVYRVINRSPDVGDEDISITREDFKSYIELGKKYRGKTTISHYSCSFFTKKDELETILKLPRPNKRIIKGYIKDIHGPIYLNNRSHVDLWLYKDVNLSSEFELEKR